MSSNRLAIAALALACIASAAAGGYLATRQNTVPDARCRHDDHANGARGGNAGGSASDDAGRCTGRRCGP